MTLKKKQQQNSTKCIQTKQRSNTLSLTLTSPSRYPISPSSFLSLPDSRGLHLLSPASPTRPNLASGASPLQLTQATAVSGLLLNPVHLVIIVDLLLKLRGGTVQPP